MQYYNTKIVDFGNGNKQVITYEKPVKIKDDEVLELELERQCKIISDDVIILDDDEIEKKALHSIFTSANRTKNELYKIARSNSWDLFITLTFSRNEVLDRTDYNYLMKKVTKLFNNIKVRKCPNLKYILVPEQHKKIESNGKRAWHFHGLLGNASDLSLSLIDKKLKCTINCKDDVFKMNDFKLGYSTATYVKNNDAVTRYISKYITKSLCFQTKNKRRYLSSHNCLKPKEYTFMCYNHYDLTPFNVLDNTLYFDDLIDLEKCVWKKEKVIDTIDFKNTYTYYELKNDYSRILQNNIVTQK